MLPDDVGLRASITERLSYLSSSLLEGKGVNSALMYVLVVRMESRHRVREMTLHRAMLGLSLVSIIESTDKQDQKATNSIVRHAVNMCLGRVVPGRSSRLCVE